MERAIGEVFEYEGKKLKVMEDFKGCCCRCYFHLYYAEICKRAAEITGKCEGRIFREVQE